jgi:uncharacterized protein YndB with AHSA1/START domain
METSSALSPSADRELVTTRVLNAPRELVWRAWSDPGHIGQWWGPNDFRTTTSEFDLRAGGVWRFVMHGPDGRDYPNRVTFREVQAPGLLSYHHDDDGDGAIRFETTVLFEERGDQTAVTMRALFPTAETLALVVREYGAAEGAQQNMVRLASYVAALKDAGAGPVSSDFKVEAPGELQIVITRTFDAPAELLFRAMTAPEHVAQWWGPRGYAMVHCEMDFRPGGRWRFIQRDLEGNEHAFRGEFLAIEPPTRVVQTFEYEPWAGHVSTETMTLTPMPDGRTSIEVVSVFSSVEDRDGMLSSGMEGGARETYDRLEEYARSL